MVQPQAWHGHGNRWGGLLPRRLGLGADLGLGRNPYQLWLERHSLVDRGRISGGSLAPFLDGS